MCIYIMSLYLKYRPKDFSDVVGQHHITDILLAQAQAGTFSHNYLLYGPRWTGKTSSARLLGKMANTGSTDLATDPIAQIIDKGQTLDFVEIDAASHTWVDNIREEIIDKALYPPTQLKKKVYIIDEVHMLSKGAFNALLKIMEEPPSYLLFVLATTEINKVPDTIISRCQVFNFKRIGIADIVERLKYIAEQEQISYEEEGLRLLAKLSSGALRDAIKYLEQVSMLWTVTAANVSQFLGVVPDAVIAQFVTLLQSGDADATYAYIDELYDTWTDLAHFSKDVLLRLDEQFMQNPAVYSTLAWCFREIYSDVKRYPYPVLVYKSKLHRYFTESVWQSMPLPPSQGNVSSQQVPPVPVEKAVPAEQEKPQESKQEQIASTPEPIVSKKQENWSLDGQELMQKLIARVDKMMIKSILKNNTMVESITDTVVSLIVINEQYYTLLQKAETITYMSDLISQIIWSEKQLIVKYMSKEDYLKKSLA